MTLAAATLSNLPDLPALLFFMAVIIFWATIRPSMIRDYDNHRLPPHHPTAKFLYVVLSLMTYVVLVVAFHSFSDAAIKISASIPFVDRLVSSFQDQAPLLAAGTFFGLLQIGFLRDIERHTLVWLYSARHLHRDVQELSGHLQRGVFVPSDDEKAKYRDEVRRHGVFVLDGTAGPAAGPVTLGNWQKVGTLLLLLREWNANARGLLNDNELKTLTEAETTHERKTVLALAIVRTVERATHVGVATETLNELLGMLTATSHIDRTRIAEVEVRARALLNGEAALNAPPLRLTSDELTRHVAQIEGYFRIEYQMLLEQAATLTAKSVILAGERAPERFEQLKAAGFSGLGRIEPINFDRILSLFIAIFLGGFVVLFIGNVGKTGSPPAWDAIARFSLVMAIAALIGANVGSNRRYQRRRSTPWGIYATAGLAAATVHFGITVLWDLGRAYLVEAKVLNYTQPKPLIEMLPWTLLPALMTIAICRLARFEHYPFVPAAATWRGEADRILDGVCTSLAVLLGYYSAITIILIAGWNLPPAIAEKMSSAHLLPVPIIVPLQILGFFIGMIAVADIRKAAHARMVDLGEPRAPLAPSATAPLPDGAIGGGLAKPTRQRYADTIGSASSPLNRMEGPPPG